MHDDVKRDSSWTQTCNCYSCDVCRDDGRTEILTKGDNNPVDDRGLYNPGQLWLEPSDIMGRAKGYVKRTLDVACLRYAHVNEPFLLLYTAFCPTSAW